MSATDSEWLFIISVDYYVCFQVENNLKGIFCCTCITNNLIRAAFCGIIDVLTLCVMYSYEIFVLVSKWTSPINKFTVKKHICDTYSTNKCKQLHMDKSVGHLCYMYKTSQFFKQNCIYLI